MKFDLASAPTESTIVRYFEEGLKPFIKAKINQENSQQVNYEELVVKAVRAGAKTGL